MNNARAKYVLNRFVEEKEMLSDLMTAVNTLFRRTGFTLVKGDNPKALKKENEKLKAIISEVCSTCLNPSGDCTDCPIKEVTGGR